MQWKAWSTVLGAKCGDKVSNTSDLWCVDIAGLKTSRDERTSNEQKHDQHRSAMHHTWQVINIYHLNCTTGQVMGNITGKNC